MKRQFIAGPTIGGAHCDQRREVFDARNQQLVVEEAKIKYLFLGDSLTELMSAPLYLNSPAGLTINRGICGDVVKHMKLRLEADVLQLAPENLILLGGTNDLAEMIVQNVSQQQMVDRVYCDLAEIVNRAVEEQITVYLGTMTPTNQQYCYHQEKKQAIFALNQKLKELAAGKRQITILNYYQQLVDEAGNLVPQYTTDGLHLTPAGYQQLASELQKKV